MSSESETGTLLAGLLTGIVVGAALGLVYAPSAGRETRETLEQKAVIAKQRAEHALEIAKQRLAQIRQHNAAADAAE